MFVSSFLVPTFPSPATGGERQAGLVVSEAQELSVEKGVRALAVLLSEILGLRTWPSDWPCGLRVTCALLSLKGSLPLPLCRPRVELEVCGEKELGFLPDLFVNRRSSPLLPDDASLPHGTPTASGETLRSSPPGW